MEIRTHTLNFTLLNLDEYVKLQHDNKFPLSFFLEKLVELDPCVCSCNANGTAARDIGAVEQK